LAHGLDGLDRAGFASDLRHVVGEVRQELRLGLGLGGVGSVCFDSHPNGSVDRDTDLMYGHGYTSCGSVLISCAASTRAWAHRAAVASAAEARYTSARPPSRSLGGISARWSARSSSRLVAASVSGVIAD